MQWLLLIEKWHCQHYLDTEMQAWLLIIPTELALNITRQLTPVEWKRSRKWPYNDPEQYAGGSGWVGIPTLKLRKRGTKRHLVPFSAQYYRLRKHTPKTIRMSFSIHEMVLAVIEVSIKSICSTTESALRLMAIIENRIKYGRNYFNMAIYPFYEWWLTGLSLICLKPIGNSEVLRG